MDRSIFPAKVIFETMPSLDAWPACCVAMCDLAGCLEDAQSEEDLDEGVKHYEALVGSDVMDTSRLEGEVIAVIEAVMEWASGGRGS